MPTRDEITVQVRELIVQSLSVGADEVRPDASFIDDLGADSLAIVELVMAIEKRFKIAIPDEDAEKITTVQDAVDYIVDHLG
jgi:acyl carrier protein